MEKVLQFLGEQFLFCFLVHSRNLVSKACKEKETSILKSYSNKLLRNFIYFSHLNFIAIIVASVITPLYREVK